MTASDRNHSDDPHGSNPRLASASSFPGLSYRPAGAPEQLAEINAELRDARRSYEAGDPKLALRGLGSMFDALESRIRAGSDGDCKRLRRSALILLGSVQDALGATAEAHGAYEQALDAADAEGDSLGTGAASEDAELGVALQFVGRSAEAIERLERALEHGVREPDVLRALAVALLSQGADSSGLATAEGLLRDALALAPWDPRIMFSLTAVLAAEGEADAAAEQATELGFALGMTGRLEEADLALGAAIEFGEQTSLALLGRAEIRRQVGDFDEAARLVAEALEVAPEDPVALTLDGTIRMSRGEPNEAIAVLEAALRAAPDDVHALSNYSLALQLVGRVDEASRVLDRAQSLADGEEAQLVLQEAQLLLDKNETEHALARFERVLELDPEQPPAHVGRGEALRRLHRFDEALEALDRGIAMGAETAYAIGTRGQVLTALGRYVEAVDVLEVATAQEQGLAWIHTAFGSALWMLERYDAARDAFERALQLEPDNTDALVGRGGVLRYLGESEEALRSLDRALELDPDNLYAQSKRGQVLYALERYDEAEVVLEHAIKLYSNGAEGSAIGAEAAEAFAWYGETVRLQGRASEALAPLGTALELIPGDAWTLATRGQALSSLGRLDEAIEDLRQAMEQTPTLTWAWEELGTVLRRAGHTDEAIEAYTRGLEHGLDPLSVLAGQVGALELAGRPSEALVVVDKALEDNAEDPFVLATRARVLSGTGRYKEAVDWADRAIAADGDYDWAYLIRGWARRNLSADHCAAARQDFEAAARLDPEYPEYRQKLGDVVALIEGRDAARPHFEWVLENSTAATDGDAFGILVIGWSQFGLGRFDDACRSYRHAMDLGGEDTATRLDNALALLASGRSELALREYELALESETDEHPGQRRCQLAVAQRELSEAKQQDILDGTPGVEEAERALAAALAATAG